MLKEVHLRDKDRNKIAALMSVIPGLGHLYKHHYVEGIGFLTVGNVLMVFVTALLSIATFGVAIVLVPTIYVAAVAYAAYSIPDWHGKHEILHPWRQQNKDHH
ncbi:hypothetical protein [Persicirhabdus sediminis]|uniref:Uncharacterized protein n=1 Tax=Persicirhabdus sediminis TaxID=454144 RepID=A0A8J7MEN0_9BACT|nr:hypothetical protein [Persicirhabdus sediminis]MBK1790444.1 hypothetical protein [Persicirhabdus sediminis]